MQNLFAIIMCGGEGTRFYPFSTPDKPKQFLNFIGDRSLIRQAFERILPLVKPERVYVSTGEKYVELVREHLPEVLAENIIAEPVKKNTGPALTYATNLIHERHGDAVVCCMPSDHHIGNEAGFRNIIEKGSLIAGDGYLVTLGMKPTWPSTDYGYICPEKAGAEWSPVKKFTEKPGKEIAEQYIKERYLWNGGIFIWKTSTLLTELNKYVPELNPSNYDSRFTIHEYFEAVPSISIDYALMEKSSRVAVIPADIDWSDVGTWDSLEKLVNEGVDVSPHVISILNNVVRMNGDYGR